MADAVRKASSADVADIVRLNREVQALHAEHEPDLFKPTGDPAAMAEYFAECLAKANNEMGIVGEPGAPLGYVWFECQQKPETALMHPLTRLYIYHIAVSSAAREKGVGRLLMAWAEDRARALDADHIALSYIPANDTARRFYEVLGFSTERVVLQKKVG